MPEQKVYTATDIFAPFLEEFANGDTYATIAKIIALVLIVGLISLGINVFLNRK